MNEQGSIQNTYTYEPFGKVRHQSERVRNIFLYVGKFGVIRDDEIKDIFLMRARHYDAQHGRFISLDPAGQCSWRSATENNLVLVSAIHTIQVWVEIAPTATCMHTTVPC